MAVDDFSLPKNPRELARVIDLHSEREEGRLSYRRTMWLLAWYYINGARRFDVFDPNTGTIDSHVLDNDGNLEFQSQELLSQLDRTMGRLASMDLRPQVTRNGLSLGAIRDRAISQILLDGTVSADQVAEAKSQFAHLLSLLGSCGITGHVIDMPTIGLTSDLEVVHPQEVYPFPSLGVNYTRLRGIVRERVVTLSYLQRKFGRRIKDNLQHMEWWEHQAGEVMAEHDEYDAQRTGHYTHDSGTAGSHDLTGSETTIGVVKIRELWLWGPRGTVSRYVLASGDYIVKDDRFDGLEVYCPIGWARFIESSTFHGLGAFDLLFPIARELERLLKSLFNNIRDTDKYGIVVIPQGQFSEKVVLRDVGNGLRMLPWDPDPVHEGFRPFPITPFNYGDVPGKVAAFAREMMGGISPWRDLADEKGRVDSATGLQVLEEAINQGTANATQSMARAWSSMYKSTLRETTRSLHEAPRPMPVQNLTLDLAGAVIDSEDNTVGFPENPLPTLSQVTVSVKERHPRSGTARKQEAVQLFELGQDSGLVDPDAFKLFAVEEGLDFAMWLRDYESAYESVVRNCLLLYGNGDEPGMVVVTPHTAKPEIQMRVLESFMSDPRMSLASPDVQNEFKRYREFLMDAMGLTLPQAVPNPEELAMLTPRGAQELERQVAGMLPQAQGQGAMSRA